MKTVGKLKLTQLSKAELSKREENSLLGGDNCCICGCAYKDHSGSSTGGNGGANTGGGDSGLFSPGGGTGYGSFA